MAFDAARALHWLGLLSTCTTGGSPSTSGGDPPPFDLRRALARTGAEVLEEVPLHPADAPGAGSASTAGLPLARVRGRAGGNPAPPWLLCTPCYLPSELPSGPSGPWRPNAHGSGLALLLALLEALAGPGPAAQPAQDVLCVPLPAPGPEHTGASAAERWASKEILPLQGVIAVWRIAGPGLRLALDTRCLGSPASRELTHELLLLGRVLGHEAFTPDAQTAFPGPHVPFLEHGRPVLALCGYHDPLAGTEDDRLAAASADSLQAVGETLLRFLRGERAV